MVPFKGRSTLRQYNPNKPKKWGYKFYVLSSGDGLVYNFEVHTSSIEACPGQPDIGASGNTVLHLLQHVERQKWHKLFIDNWYTGVPLAVNQVKQGIVMVGTIKNNCLTNCSMPSDTELRVVVQA